ncbi:hypothetical protein THARTR1_10744 [Trichoderma harzianum]|uniref:Uncharacterized protein n=1 Tax=Trichoderma harzianum TaxID=5544 RepID=A0A2K0TLL8_TRIHA|nr:hypothetical protein THARTR1_10744 [Trichoderma harzianum]
MNAHCGKWDSAVHAAVNGGHMNVVEFLVSRGANVNSQSPLFVHIPERDTHLLGYLLNQGMNLDMQDEQHGTALHKAITIENSTHFELLLERGADINALSEKLGTPLQAACVTIERYTPGKLWSDDGILHNIEKLLDSGADPNIRGGKYATALQAACSTSYYMIESATKVVRLLIEHGADVNVQGGRWGSALHAAAASKYFGEKVEMMKLLLDNGAKIDQRGNDGETPLHVACREGTLEAVRFLVDRGADVNAESGRFGTPILAAAAREDSMPFLTLLMDKGATMNYEGGEYGSALQAHCWSSFDNIETLRFLLNHCANVNAKGGKYGTALIAICAHTFDGSLGKECVRLLLDHGADVNVQSDEYGTALIAACGRRKEDTTTVQWLLECGADVNAQGGQHGTALSAACSGGHSQVVELLLNNGAHLHLQDCAAWYSAIRGITTYEDDAAVLELLLNHGMDISHEHAEYGTALHVMMMMTAEPLHQGWRAGINVLLKHHINPDIMNEQLGSALHIACATKHEDVNIEFKMLYPGFWHMNELSSKAEFLLEQWPNVNVNAQGGSFGTALQAAAYSGQTLTIRMLLDRKANVDAHAGKYHSALNGAIIGGRWNIVKILLAAGATPDCHLQEHPDEGWLQTVLEEDGRGAVERYRKFWEVELEKKRGGAGA